MHPDAESLTAFAEQVLPLAEREEILAHMSACSRCREVVFLAQHAAEEDQSTPVVLVAEERSRPRKSWFDWRWAWIPAAACAGLIGVAVVQHNRRVATETQTAANVAPSDALRATASPKAALQNPVPQNEPRAAKQATVSGSVEEREFAPQTLARDEAKRLDANKPTDKKDVGVRATVPAILLAPGVSGGSTHGMMAARAKTSSIGGPSAANQFQQQNMANQQNTLQQSSGAQLDAANSTVKAAPAPQAESETVTVNAQAVAPAPARAATGAAQAQAPAQLSIPTTEQSDAVSLAGVAGFSKKQKASLPSGLEALSVVSGR